MAGPPPSCWAGRAPGSCVVDRELASAQETADLIKKDGGEAWAFAADVTREDDVRRLIAAALERAGRIDILHNNVGASLALGDAVGHRSHRGGLRPERRGESEGHLAHLQARPARPAGGAAARS